MGIKPIASRLQRDEELLKRAIRPYGIPKIFLRNAIPVQEAKEYVDEYEITPKYSYRWDKTRQKVEVKKRPWVVKDDEGLPSYSLLPAPVVVSLIKQLADFL